MEIRERQNAFALEADVEEYGVGGDSDDGAFELFRTFIAGTLSRVALLKLREQVAEGFVGVRLGLGVSSLENVGLDMKRVSVSRINPN